MKIDNLIVLNSAEEYYEKQYNGRRPNIIWLLTDQDEEELLCWNIDKIKWIKIVELTDYSQYFIRKITDISRLNLPKNNAIIISWRHHA